MVSPSLPTERNPTNTIILICVSISEVGWWNYCKLIKQVIPILPTHENWHGVCTSISRENIHRCLSNLVRDNFLLSLSERSRSNYAGLMKIESWWVKQEDRVTNVEWKEWISLREVTRVVLIEAPGEAVLMVNEQCLLQFQHQLEMVILISLAKLSSMENDQNLLYTATMTWKLIFML